MITAVRPFVLTRAVLLAAWVFAPLAVAADASPGFETQDLDGATTHYSGTVGTTAVAIPAVAGSVISEVVIKCPYQTPVSKKLLVSFDGGTNFFTLDPGDFIGWSVKGRRTQIHIKGSTAGVAYDVILNREAY